VSYPRTSATTVPALLVEPLLPLAPTVPGLATGTVAAHGYPAGGGVTQPASR